MDKLETTGVVVPTIALDSRVLSVSASLYAEYQLSLSKLSIVDVVRLTPQTLTANIFRMFAACVAENYPEGEAPTADQWARKVSALEDHQAKLQEIVAVVTAAVKKRFPAPVLPAAVPEAKPADPLLN
jgi:hypothetical protein